MSISYGNQSNNRNVDAPRSYRVRLARYGTALTGDRSPSPLTVYITASSSIQARMNAQSSYPGFSVTDVAEA